MQVVPPFEQEFLPLRAKILEIAAALDRLDRIGGATSAREPRVAKIRSAVEALLSGESDRAEQVQLIFSRPYAENWRQEFQISNDE
jgi:hypothetical protein